MWVDNGDSGDFNIDNIAPFIGDNKGSIEYSNYTLYDRGDYLEIQTKLPFGELTLGKKNWRIIAHDSAGNIREESVDFYVDSSTSTTPQPVTKLKDFFSDMFETKETTQDDAQQNQQPIQKIINEVVTGKSSLRRLCWLFIPLFLFLFFLLLLWRKKRKKEKEHKHKKR